MKHLKKINELNYETYKRAAEKAKEYGQINTYRAFMDMYNDRKPMDENKFKRNLFRNNSFKMLISEVLYDGEESKVKPEILDINIGDIDVPDDDFCFIFLEGDFDKFGEDIKDYDGEEPIMLHGSIEALENGSPSIVFSSDKNKFASRKDLNTFIKILEKVYMIEDKTTAAKAIASASDVKVDNVKNGMFHEFINENFGDFKTFKSKINPRKYYDRM